jgi:hypothetical protein
MIYLKKLLMMGMLRNTSEEPGMNTVPENAEKPGTSAHASTKNFTCSWCHKSFDFKYRLDRHVRKHTGDTVHPTAVCCA